MAYKLSRVKIASFKCASSSAHAYSVWIQSFDRRPTDRRTQDDDAPGSQAKARRSFALPSLAFGKAQKVLAN